MTNLSEIAVEQYLENKRLIISVFAPNQYTDEQLHETAVEWTMEDIVSDIMELLEEYSDHIAI